MGRSNDVPAARQKAAEQPGGPTRHPQKEEYRAYHYLALMLSMPCRKQHASRGRKRNHARHLDLRSLSPASPGGRPGSLQAARTKASRPLAPTGASITSTVKCR
jgi:hypothetical protein